MSTPNPLETPSTGLETAESANPSTPGSAENTQDPVPAVALETKSEAEGKETKERLEDQSFNELLRNAENMLSSPDFDFESFDASIASCSSMPYFNEFFPNFPSSTNSSSLSSAVSSASSSVSSSSSSSSTSTSGSKSGAGTSMSSSSTDSRTAVSPDGSRKPAGASQGLQTLLAAVSNPSSAGKSPEKIITDDEIKTDSEDKKRAEESTKKEKLYVDKNNLGRLFDWESDKLPQAIRDHALTILGKAAVPPMAPSSKKNRDRINASPLVQERLRQEAIELPHSKLTPLQFGYLRTDRVKQKIREGCLTVSQAIYETRHSITAPLFNSPGNRILALGEGCSIQETSGANWSAEHSKALYEKIPYETIVDLNQYQAQGLRLGLHLKQVQIKDNYNLWKKVAFVEKEKKKIESNNQERVGKINSQRFEEDKKRHDEEVSKDNRRKEEDTKWEEETAIEIKIAIERNESLPEADRMKPEDIQAQINAKREKQKEPITTKRIEEDQSAERTFETIVEKRKQEDQKLKEETAQKLREYFDQLAGLNDNQLEGLDKEFTLEEVRAPWFSLEVFEAMKLEVPKHLFKILKLPLRPKHIDALKMGYSFFDIKDLAEHQVIFMQRHKLNHQLSREDVIKIEPQHLQINSDIMSQLIKERKKKKIPLFDDIKGLSKNEQLQGLLAGLTRKELDEIERFGSTQTPSFGFTPEHVKALQKGYKFADIRDKQLHQLRLMIELGLSPQYALKVNAANEHSFLQSFKLIQTKGLDIKGVLQAEFNALQIWAYANGMPFDWTKANPAITNNQIKIIQHGLDPIHFPVLEEFQLNLLFHPNNALSSPPGSQVIVTPKQAQQLRTPEQAKRLISALPKLKGKSPDEMDEMIKADLDSDQMEAFVKGYDVKTCAELKAFQWRLVFHTVVPLRPEQARKVTSQEQSQALCDLIITFKEKGIDIDEVLEANLSPEQMQAVIKGHKVKEVQGLQDFQVRLLLDPLTPLKLEQARKVTSPDLASSLEVHSASFKEKNIDIDELIGANLNYTQIQAVLAGFEIRDIRGLEKFQVNALHSCYNAPVLEKGKKRWFLTAKHAQQLRTPEQASRIVQFTTKLKEKGLSESEMDEVIRLDLDDRHMEAFIKAGDAKTCRELQEFQLNLVLHPSTPLTPRLAKMVPSSKAADALRTVLNQDPKQDIERLVALNLLQLQAVALRYPLERVLQLEGWRLKVLVTSEGLLSIAQVTPPWFTRLHGLCLQMEIDYKEIAGKPAQDLVQYLGTITPLADTLPLTPTPGQPLLFSAASSASSSSSSHAPALAAPALGAPAESEPERKGPSQVTRVDASQ